MNNNNHVGPSGELLTYAGIVSAFYGEERQQYQRRQDAILQGATSMIVEQVAETVRPNGKPTVADVAQSIHAFNQLAAEEGLGVMPRTATLDADDTTNDTGVVIYGDFRPKSTDSVSGVSSHDFWAAG